MDSSLSARLAPIPDSLKRSRLGLADHLEKQLATVPPWYDFPNPQDGTHGFPKPILNDSARVISIDRPDGPSFQLRVIDPPTKPSKGVWLHFHAEPTILTRTTIGGFVIGSNASYDTYLARLSKELGLTMASVEYRLAPEHPCPAGRDDAVDAALYALSEDGKLALGATLRVLGGESAGAWYTVAVALALRDEHNIDIKSQLYAIFAGYGIFDLTYTPCILSHKRAIVFSGPDMIKFSEAAFAHVPMADRKKPAF